MKKVSIIISTYNRRLALEKSLRSVLCQDYKNIEVVIVDDGSTDETESYIKSRFTDERIRYITLPRNMGATVARNTGLDEASGEYTIVWDSDDELDSSAVTTLVAAHEKYPSSTVVSAPTRVLVDGEQIVIPTIPPGELRLEVIVCALMPKYKLVRLVHVETGGTVRYKGRNLDFMVNSELAECGIWIHLQQPLGTHYLLSDENSLTRKRKVPNSNRSIERMPHLVAYIEHFGDILAKHCPGRYAAHGYGAALGLLLDGKVLLARHYLQKAVQYDPHLFLYRALLVLTFIPKANYLLRAFFSIKRFVMSRL